MARGTNANREICMHTSNNSRTAVIRTKQEADSVEIKLQCKFYSFVSHGIAQKVSAL